MSRPAIPKFLLQQMRRQAVIKPRRVGIFAGTFDPVHSGHITFALQALQSAELDEIIFLPERRPRHKPHAEHFGHRVAMLTRATAPYPRMSVAEMVDARFSGCRTLRQLHAMLPGATLVLLAGSDTVAHIADWADSDTLLKDCELVIGIRDGQTEDGVRQVMADWPVQPPAVQTMRSYGGDISSEVVREALRRGERRPGVLLSVIRYARQNWLYVSLPSHPAKM